MFSTTRWKIADFENSLLSEFTKKLKCHPIVARLLLIRGIEDLDLANLFITSDKMQLLDPYRLKDMDVAINRIKTAIEKKERILIYGDYDVDGITSIVLMVRTLQDFGAEVLTHIPHRMHDGYGLKEDIGEIAQKKEVDLIITVDCGITAVSQVEAVNQFGIDVIIIDHHEQGKTLPQAVAVVDPKRHDCNYPCPQLAAVGLVGKVIQALKGELSDDDLALIALGTIADVVPLVGENRIFVKAGLPKIDSTKIVGLKALMEIARIKGKKMKPYHAGFILGPRINASGRMGSAQDALNLLLSNDYSEALKLAKNLETINTSRQKMQRDVIKEALALVEQEVNFNEQKVIVVGKEGWHKGILGIAASRIVETYYRPAIIISLGEDSGVASARSIAGFPLNRALAHCASILENYGGHRLAAGLQIKTDKVVEFRKTINDFAEKLLTPADLIPSLVIDAQISLSDLSMGLVEEIQKLEPYGEGNPEPLFCSRGLIVKSKPRSLARETLKFWVTDGSSTFSVIGFGMARFSEVLDVGHQIDIVYQLGIDDWNKDPCVQLKLKDIKMAS